MMCTLFMHPQEEKQNVYAAKFSVFWFSWTMTKRFYTLFLIIRIWRMENVFFFGKLKNFIHTQRKGGRKVKEREKEVFYLTFSFLICLISYEKCYFSLIVKISLLSSVFDNVSKEFFFHKTFLLLVVCFFFNLKVTGKYSLQNALCVCVCSVIVDFDACTNVSRDFFFFCWMLLSVSFFSAFKFNLWWSFSSLLKGIFFLGRKWGEGIFSFFRAKREIEGLGEKLESYSWCNYDTSWSSTSWMGSFCSPSPKKIEENLKVNWGFFSGCEKVRKLMNVKVDRETKFDWWRFFLRFHTIN